MTPEGRDFGAKARRIDSRPCLGNLIRAIASKFCIAIAICAVAAEADSRADVERFGNSRKEWFASFLDILNGAPSRGALGRVFAIIDIERFDRCFAEWF